MAFKQCSNCGNTENYDLGELETDMKNTSPVYISNKTIGVGFGKKTIKYNTKAVLCLGCGQIHLFAKGNWQNLKKI